MAEGFFAMLSLRKPTAESLRRILAAQASLDFTYPDVGATAGDGPMPPDYVADHTRVDLGRGAAVFQRARAALAQWDQFRLGWLKVFPSDTPLRTGETVVVVARALGLWTVNAARIVYTIDEPADCPIFAQSSAHIATVPLSATARFGFAYGTLPDHVESGEERFLLEWDRATDQVWFDIRAFSRPRHILSRVGYPFARAMQKRFAAHSAAAMQRAAADRA